MPGKTKKDGGLESSPVYKKSPLYNYKSPGDYKVFNMGNKASPPFKMKGYSYPGTSPMKDGKVLQFMTSKRMHKDHPVTPPTTRRDTLKGLTGFEYDFPIVSKVHKIINPVSITKRKVEAVKNIGKDVVKKVKKIKKYFTER